MSNDSGSRKAVRSRLVRRLPSRIGAMVVAFTLGVVGIFGAVAAPQAAAAETSTAGQFHSLAPQRIMDTRDGTGDYYTNASRTQKTEGPIAATSAVYLTVGGNTDVPSTATAVVLNVTVTEPAGSGWITVYPYGTTQPNASNLNFTAGQDVPNLVVVKLSQPSPDQPKAPSGLVSFRNNSSGKVHLIADVAGFFDDQGADVPGAFSPNDPYRLLDTRNQIGVTTTTPVAGNGEVSVKIADACAAVDKDSNCIARIPTDATAVTLNVTVTEPQANGWTIVYPSGGTRPNVSNLNFTAGLTVPNLVTVKVGSDGYVKFFNASPGATHLIADLAGYFIGGTPEASGAFVPLDPARILDTRDGTGATKAPVASEGQVSLQVTNAGGVPDGVTEGVAAVVMNVTVTEPKSKGFITVYPSDAAEVPGVSNLNYLAGQNIPNLVVVKLGADGKVNLYNKSTSTTHLVADVAGYFIKLFDFQKKGTPTITGTAQVDQTLTASAGDWGTPTPTFAYQWIRVLASGDYEVISGATSTTYKVQDVDADCTLKVQVTATKTGYTTSYAESEPTATVATAPFKVGTVTITGTELVGQDLTVNPGTWTPTPEFSYQWYRVADDDTETAITDATAATYKIQLADIGFTLRADVTGTRTGYTTQTVSASTSAPIKTTDFTDTPKPVIDNTAPKVKDVLTATTPDWNPQATFAYQWFRAGEAITDLTSANTYTVRDVDADSKLTVKVTGTLEGYTTTTIESAETAVVARIPFESTPKPTISDTTPTVGDVLVADTAAWTPTATFSYQWYSGEDLIDGATGTSYTVKVGDAGSPLTVKVTGKRTGYLDTIVSSDSTEVVATAPFSGATVTITGTPQVGETLTADTSTWDPMPTFTYQWYRVDSNGTLTPVATTADYVVKAADVDNQLMVKVTGSLEGQTPTTVESAKTDVVIEGEFAKGTPTIAGTAQVGLTLTASPGTWDPVPAYGYQWFRGTDAAGSSWTAVTGVVSETTYSVQPADAGLPLKVRVTGTLAGYTTDSNDSAATGVVAEGEFATGDVSIQGTVKVGETLTAIEGAWTPVPTADEFSYQWYRGVTAGGSTTWTPVGSEKIYTVQPEDGGNTLKVTVTASKTGYEEASASAETGAVQKLDFVKGEPSISGNAQVDETLTADEGTWTPVPDAGEFSYQWYRGVTVDGSTTWTLVGNEKTYVVQPDDVGNTLKVDVTAKKVGYNDATAGSDPVTVS